MATPRPATAAAIPPQGTSNPDARAGEEIRRAPSVVPVQATCTPPALSDPVQGHRFRMPGRIAETTDLPSRRRGPMGIRPVGPRRLERAPGAWQGKG